MVQQVEPDVIQPAPAAQVEEEKASVTPPAQTPQETPEPQSAIHTFLASSAAKKAFKEDQANDEEEDGNPGTEE